MRKSNSNQLVSLGDISTIRAGYSFRKKIQVAPSGVYVVQMKDVSMRNGLAVNSLEQAVLPGRPPVMWCEEGDILFLTRGRNNFAIEVKGVKSKRIVCTPHFFHIRLNASGINPDFIVWQINQEPIQTYLSENGSGKGTNNINREVLENVQLGVPSLDNQNQILKLQKQINEDNQRYERMIEEGEQKMAQLAKKLLDA